MSDKPIEGVGTSTAAFIGVAEKGPVLPVAITGFAAYQQAFGGYRTDSFLTHAVEAFFKNGGTRLYVVRALPKDAANARLQGSLPISAASAGAWGNDISISITNSSDANPAHFRIDVLAGFKNVVESYDNLAATAVARLINSKSQYIVFAPKPAVRMRPTNTRAPMRLRGGSDGNAAGIDFGSALHALDTVADVSLIAIPGMGDAVTVNKALSYCKNERPLRDCFFIADVGVASSVPDVAAALAFAASIDRSVGDFGAAYFPWLWAGNPPIALPPSGFVAGIYARTDTQRGVLKSPAGLDATVVGASGDVVEVSAAQQGQLNPLGIDVIRRLPTGLVVWGARTLGSDPEWRYVPARRLDIFLRTSIHYGIQWAAFEPNGPPLWQRLRLTVESFLMTQFRNGALKGTRPEEAFFVRCDATTTTQADIDAGVVYIMVGYAPVRPAEFIVFTLSQYTQSGGA